jgi:hypothetical protein
VEEDRRVKQVRTNEELGFLLANGKAMGKFQVLSYHLLPAAKRGYRGVAERDERQLAAAGGVFNITATKSCIGLGVFLTGN